MRSTESIVTRQVIAPNEGGARKDVFLALVILGSTAYDLRDDQIGNGSKLCFGTGFHFHDLRFGNWSFPLVLPILGLGWGWVGASVMEGSTSLNA